MATNNAINRGKELSIVRTSASGAYYQTGDGTLVKIAFDNIIVGEGSNYDAINYQYTINNPGPYFINVKISQRYGQLSSHDKSQVFIYKNGIQAYEVLHSHSTNILISSDTNFIFTGNMIAPFVNGDILSFYFQVSGGTKNVGIGGVEPYRTTVAVFKVF